MRFSKALQEQYLDLIRDGMQRGAAADALNLRRRPIRAHIATHDQFRLAVEDAEADATEHVLEALYRAATGGHVGAAKTWLELRGQVKGFPALGRSTSTSTPRHGDPFADLDNVEPLEPRRRRAR